MEGMERKAGPTRAMLAILRLARVPSAIEPGLCLPEFPTPLQDTMAAAWVRDSSPLLASSSFLLLSHYPVSVY